MMDIDAIPQPGGFAVANHTMPSVGGSFRVMQAASRIGAATKHAGVIGNGPWASLIRKALNDNGIEHIGQDRIDADSGFRLVLNDRRAQDVRRHVWRRITRQREHVRLRGARRGRCGAHQRQHADGSQRVRHRRLPASHLFGPDDARLQHRAQSDQHAAHGQRPPAGGSGAGAAHLVLQTVRRPARSPTGLACSWTIPCR